jgi:FkbM family methyltransferase
MGRRTQMNGTLRRLGAWPPARVVLTWRPVEHIVATLLRGALLRETARFTLRELMGRSVVGSYRLRRSGLRVQLRHGTPDVLAFDEVFYQRHYELPGLVTRALEGTKPRILDLGANIGLFALAMFERYSEARVVAVEPDRFNAALLRRAIALNGRGDDWTLIEAAASNADGSVQFLAGRFSLSQLAAAGDEPDAEAVPAVDVLPHLAASDFVKLDIEGGEWAILSDDRFPSFAPRAIVLEYHPYLCPAPDARAAALELLQRAGYAHRPIFDRSDGTGMLWAWRPE